MENASKALIIAGSVILAIMIVALGVKIFNSAQNAADTSNLESTEIAMINQNFEKFIKDDQLGSQVKSLISHAISNASTNGEDPIRLPQIKYGSYDTGTGKNAASSSANLQEYINVLGNIRGAILSNKYYDVKCTYGTSGLITKITIEESS